MHIELKLGELLAEAAITGEIDGRTAPEVQERLLPVAGTHQKLLIDMTQVTFLSSAGLRMLLLLYRQFAPRAGEILLVGVPEEIRDTMAMTGFSNFFTLAETRDQALAKIR
jgi:anti-sigma B factor antagonist